MSTIVNIQLNTSTATQLPVGPNGHVTLINNQTTNKIFIGGGSGVTGTNGLQLPSGTSVDAPAIFSLTGINTPIWAISTVAAQTIWVITS
jgi:hypothetical protein